MFSFKTPVLRSSLAITTGAGCRNHCSYCPQENFVRSYHALSEQVTMNLATFRACIKSVPKDICLSFSGFCEPWLNPHCTGMVLYAHEKGFRIRVNTTLVGMTTEDVRLLTRIPFVKFVVHLPDNSGLTRIRTNGRYFEVLSALVSARIKNVAWKFHNPGPGADIHSEVKQVLFKAGCRVTYAPLNNRAGNITVNDSYSSVNLGKALHPCQDFRHNILLPNGDVALCHMDWSLRHILGNLLEISYANLFKGKVFYDLNAALDNPGSDILCRHCEKDIVKRSLPGKISRYVTRKLQGRKDIY